MNASNCKVEVNQSLTNRRAGKTPETTGKVLHLKIEPNRTTIEPRTPVECDSTGESAGEPKLKIKPRTPVDEKSTASRRVLRYRGQAWPMYKRAGVWTMRKVLRGKIHHESLFESGLERAEVAYKIKIDALIGGDQATWRATLQRGGDAALSTCSELIQAYNALAPQLGITAATQRRNTNIFTLLLREVHGPNFGTQPLSLLSGKTARAWIGKRMAAAENEPTERRRASKLRSLKSCWQQMRSLFRPWCLAMYRDRGLLLPDVAEFLGALKERKLNVESLYFPPAAEQARKTLHAWCALKDRNMFIAVGLELCCGLRKAEISQVTWGMLTSDHRGAPLLRFEGRAKARKRGGTFSVRPLDPFWTVFRRRVDREGWRGASDELVLTGSDTEIASSCFNRISAWLRDELGWETQKTNHALRAYVASLLILRDGQAYAARDFLRHASVTTTEKHYQYFLAEIARHHSGRVLVEVAKRRGQ